MLCTSPVIFRVTWTSVLSPLQQYCTWYSWTTLAHTGVRLQAIQNRTCSNWSSMGRQLCGCGQLSTWTVHGPKRWYSPLYIFSHFCSLIKTIDVHMQNWSPFVVYPILIGTAYKISSPTPVGLDTNMQVFQESLLTRETSTISRISVQCSDLLWPFPLTPEIQTKCLTHLSLTCDNGIISNCTTSLISALVGVEYSSIWYYPYMGTKHILKIPVISSTTFAFCRLGKIN